MRTALWELRCGNCVVRTALLSLPLAIGRRFDRKAIDCKAIDHEVSNQSLLINKSLSICCSSFT